MNSSAEPFPRFFVRVSPRLPWVLAGAVTCLLLAHVGIQVFHYRVHEIDWLFKDLFDVDQENNLPTWLSNATLLLTCGILLAIANGKRRENDRYARHWLGLSVVFGFLALDEDAGLHETLNTLADQMRGGEHNTWEIVGAAAVLMFALCYLRFWWRLPPRTRLFFAVAGVGFVMGALGIEHVSQPVRSDTLQYNLMTAVEEAFEMYSIVLFVHALVSYMRAPREGTVPVGVETR